MSAEQTSLSEVLAAYLQAVDAGATPDREALCREHPGLAGKLREFFAAQDQLGRFGLPLRIRPEMVNSPEAATDAPTVPPRADGPSTAARTPPGQAAETPSAPDAVGDYEILGELGRGGMGVVYKARQTKLGRLVALKMVLAGGHAGPAELARFQTEAEAIARLQHPNIVQVHEVGVQAGRPFFSLEFCSGGSLDRKLGGTPLPAREAAALVEVLARAMQAAHEKGVIHRDLKPANVLLAEDGMPKITDFGLARKLDDAGQTQSGAVVGTPSYMAPEQAAGQSKQVGPAADVYALGAILYECLTGRPPFKAATPLDTVFQVIGNDPVPPSQLHPKLPRDLETICLKCLHKEPRRRYLTAEALAEDLRRFQRGEPIQARPVGAWERALKWMKRRPAAAALLAVSALGAVALAVISAELWRSNEDVRAEADKASRAAADARLKGTEASDERDRARKELDRARRHLFTAQLWRVAGVCEGDPYQGLLLLHDYNACPINLRDAAWRFYERRCRRERFTRLGQAATVLAVAFSADGNTLASGGREPAGEGKLGEVKLWDTATGQENASLKGVPAPVYSLAFSADGKTLASGGEAGTLNLWDAATGREKASLKGHTGTVYRVAFSPDGKTLAAAGHCRDARNPNLPGREMKLWDVATGREKASLTKPGLLVTAVLFTPNDKALAVESVAGTIKLWDVGTGLERASLKGPAGDPFAAALSPDGQTLALGSTELVRGQGVGVVRLWDVAAGREKVPLKGQPRISSLAFSPDGKTLASGGETVKLWDAATGQEKLSLRAGAREVAFSPDGNALASASEDGTVLTLWDVAAAQEKGSLKGETETVRCVALSPDGRIIARGSGRYVGNECVGALDLADVVTGREKLSLKGDPVPLSEMYSVAFSPDGKILAAATGGAVRLWDLPSGRQTASFDNPRVAVYSLAFSADGATLAAVGTGGTVKVWEVATRREKASFKGHTVEARFVAFSPDGKTLASGGDGLFDERKKRRGPGEVKLWDVATGREKASLNGLPEDVCPVAFSPDGKTLATGGGIWDPRAKRYDLTGEVKLWDAATGQAKSCLKTLSGAVYSVAFSADGKTLVLAGGTVNLWDVATGQEKAVLKGAASPAVFSPDGQTLASWSGDRTIKLWDVVTGQERASLKGHREWVSMMAFSADGKTLTSGSWQNGHPGEVKLWDLATGQERAILRGHINWVGSVAFSPDGKTIASGGGGLQFRERSGPEPVLTEGPHLSGEVKLWDAETGQEKASFLGHLAEVYAVVFSPDGKTLASGARDPTGEGKSGEVKLWDVATGWEKASLKGHTDRVTFVAFSADGKALASGSAGFHSTTNNFWAEVKLWDVATGRETASLKGQLSGVWAVAFSADGKTLASANLDGKVKLWDVTTGREKASLKGQPGTFYSVAFSPDGKTLASAGDRRDPQGRHLVGAEVKLWDVATGREKASLKGQPGTFYSVAFSPDGKTLAARSEKEVKLWDMTTGEQTAWLTGHTEAISSVAFSPDGKTLASASYDKTVRLWNVPRR